MKYARRAGVLAGASALALLLALSPAGPSTTVSISGSDFRVNGATTNAGTAAAGLLLNSRMINAVFDDANRSNDWAYPDTGVWSASRNTREFVSRISAYAANGLDAVTVGLQGGCPWPDGTCGTATRDENVSAFTASGSLKTAWLSRLRDVLDAADANGLVVDLSLFYAYQDQRVGDVETAARNVIDFLVAGGYRNVLLEVCNECNLVEFDHADLDPGVGLPALLSRLSDYAPATLPISASVTGGYALAGNVSGALLSAEDFVTFHCNEQTTDAIETEIAALRARTTKPIVTNECGSDLSRMNAAVASGVSFGYYEQGPGGYSAAGFQAVPARWGPRTSPLKRAFFDRALALST